MRRILTNTEELIQVFVSQITHLSSIAMASDAFTASLADAHQLEFFLDFPRNLEVLLVQSLDRHKSALVHRNLLVDVVVTELHQVAG